MRTFDPLARLRLVVILIVLLVMTGTLGYVCIEHMSMLNAVYMTIITLATVGYRELKELSPSGKVFTMALIVFGVVALAWALESLTEAAVTEQLSRGFWRRRMNRIIEKMKNHYIVCGHGRMGQEITEELKRRDLPFVVIEINPEQLPLLNELGYPYINGDAARDETLLQARIRAARGLVTVGPTDADNTFVTFTARGLNPSLLIVARSVYRENEEKLRRAGANRVLSPYIIGGRRMAAALLQPSVADFLDVVMHSQELEFAMDEIAVELGSPLSGRPLNELEELSPTRPAVVGIKASNGRILANPDPTAPIEAGATLIVLGTEAQIETLRVAARKQ
ncbi:MAG: potassium channel protein [Armatimonadetes bacterium CG_4_10_14_3_um_filter_59_10]|nr:MAG: potassium channel protein [Armatimonadetes bacterium CG_4_10_14_3_um_filter_59_10]